MTAPQITSADVLGALRRDLIRKPDMPSGVFLTEVGSPDGKRRADALFLPAVHGKGIIGYEVKVSRSDVLAELANPHKAESWKKYCIRWWLVVATPELIDGLDIPDDWGVITPPTQKNRRQFTKLKPAPELDPHPLGPAITRLSTLWAYQQRDHDWEKTRAAGERAGQRRIIDDLKSKLHAAGIITGPADPNHKAAVELLQALRAKKRHFYLDQKSIDELADTILEAIEVSDIRRLAASVFEQKRNQLNTALAALSDGDYRVKEIRKHLEGTPA